MKRAFTLIELLVVIAIIAILMGTLLVAGSGSTERGRAAKCATNMRNLAAAAISYSVGNDGYFPRAQSALIMKVDMSRNGKGLGYQPVKGWITFLDQGKTYPTKDTSGASQCSFAGTEDDIEYAITHGAIWSAIGGNRSSYVCPAFAAACQDAGTLRPGWSYQMSAYFGHSENGVTKMAQGIRAFGLSRADRRLLFAEIPCFTATPKDAVELPAVNLTGGNGTPECDCCLVYKSKGGSESIGFNHRASRRIFGHVAFADGHVEQITAPKNGNYLDLTDWLCRGLDVVYKNGDYEEIKNSVEQ